VAGQAGVDGSVVSRQVAALERSGYVRRRPDPADGRASLISLSPAGAVTLAHTRDVRRQWLAGVLSDRTEGDACPFSALLEKFADGLDAAGHARSTRPLAAG
jgi:DNA-binding MarR family transcriptional regulator